MSDRIRVSRTSTRSVIVTLLVVVSALSMLGGVVTAYARDTIFDSNEFADRAAEAIANPAVRGPLTAEIVDQIVALDNDLLLVRPVLEGIVDDVIQAPVFDEMLRFGIADLHRTVFSEGSDTITVQLVDFLFVVKVSLSKLDPELAAEIPQDFTDALISLRAWGALADGTQVVDDVGWLALVLPIVSFVSAAAAVALASDRRRTVMAVGFSAIAVGIVILVIETIARELFLRDLDAGDPRSVGAVLWDVYADDLLHWALILVAAGTAVAVVARTGLRSIDVRARARVLLELLEPPGSTRGRAVWAALAALIGVLLVIEWELAVRLVTTVVGVILVINAAAVLVAMLPQPVVVDGSTEDRDAGAPWTFRLGWILAGLATLVFLAVILAAISRSDGTGRDRLTIAPGCNGSVVLCDRPLDEVAFATSHNSMAAANDGFTIGYQTEGIIAQLDDGYRGFLIDAYFGIESEGVVITDRAPMTEQERSELVADVGESAVRAAEALRESRQEVGGVRDVYLCHSFCEVGAVLMADELARIGDWLDDHPGEVLVFIIQDEGPTDADIAQAFESSGLIDQVHEQDLNRPWPSLGEMIESGKRVWVSAENNPGDLAWYHDAFTYVQDTPHSQKSRAEFSCELFRGQPESPVFLINHWLSPVSPVAADEANSRPVLEERLQECEAEPRPFPNLIAVDFSDRGDLLAVVADLNGVSPIR